MQRFYSYNQYMREKFGCKMYKLSLSISNTCPNRDGTKGAGGCIFCSEGGSGDFAAAYCKSITEQIEDAKKLVSRKNRGGKYIAYFQSFTSTYIAPQKLRDALNEVLKDKDICAVSIATRADCLGDEILAVLSEFSYKIPITVEMGLQTIHDKTARLINRCCDLNEYEASLEKLKALGIEVVYHIIAGLPFETEEEFLETVRYVGKSGADGIKIQLLHILKGTELEKMFNRGEFKVFSKEEYFTLVAKALEILPPDMVIHRLTGDGAKKILIAPLWSADKKDVLNSLNRYLEENDILQGKKISDAL
ncbi:MAG: TIGR01212 family radical SAM protein [Oscillospiraceae bacterium]|nr:TIGR01212 family radical SAM protein [Oscillospiraceae bacterium]